MSKVPSRLTVRFDSPRMSARNLVAARPYHEELLRRERVAFVRYLRDRTESWVKHGSSGSRHHRA
jgi:hypothetical protein